MLYHTINVEASYDTVNTGNGTAESREEPGDDGKPDSPCVPKCLTLYYSCLSKKMMLLIGNQFGSRGKLSRTF